MRVFLLNTRLKKKKKRKHRANLTLLSIENLVFGRLFALMGNEMRYQLLKLFSGREEFCISTVSAIMCFSKPDVFFITVSALTDKDDLIMSVTHYSMSSWSIKEAG